jgi:hypothetical protein
MMGRPNTCLQSAGDRSPTPGLPPAEILRRFGLSAERVRNVIDRDVAIRAARLDEIAHDQRHARTIRARFR